MAETGATAVDVMVKSCFDAASFTQITGPPKHWLINELVGVIATVATIFKNRKYGRKTGCLALVVDQEEMRRVAKDDTLNCSRSDKPTPFNPNIGDTTTATDEKILTVDHRSTWYEYYLKQAVDLYDVATIIANTDHQYLAENHEDYVGYANKTTRSIIEQLETHPNILNE